MSKTTALASCGLTILLSTTSSVSAADVNKLFHFSLTKSVDGQVCKAYLARLNSVDYSKLGFDGAPFCNRPENSSIPGFADLNRVPVSPTEQRALILDVWNFTIPYAAGPRAALLIDDIPNRNPVWTYDPPVDIENDGKPDRIIVWRGWGAESHTGLCGLPAGGDRAFRTVQQAYVLERHENKIDQARTIAVFGRNETNELFESGHASHTQVFRPIGKSISIFKYRATYYFDAFLYDPSRDISDRGAPGSNDRLGVFVHRNGITRQLCEYQMKDPEFEQRGSAQGR